VNENDCCCVVMVTNQKPETRNQKSFAQPFLVSGFWFLVSSNVLGSFICCIENFSSASCLVRQARFTGQYLHELNWSSLSFGNAGNAPAAMAPTKSSSVSRRRGAFAASSNAYFSGFAPPATSGLIVPLTRSLPTPKRSAAAIA